jgi:hypothetical protein
MEHSRPLGDTRHRRWSWLLVLPALALSLAPWWRHHHYLRDFYDYGLVMSGVGRIAAGERPYVDFTTPIQTGVFLFNGWAEKLGGGTFQAMTWSAPAFTIMAVVALAFLLARRWSWPAATASVAAFAAMTLSQHTILWHNVLGTVLVALATWSAALAPVWRRADWRWHLVTALALLVGGITKLNFQLIAVAGVAGWALRAGGTGRASWSRVAGTLGGVLGCAFVVPIAFEVAWTHASPALWWYNVVALPFGSRSDDLSAALHWKFYFSIHHDYYGRLPVPQLGALGVAVTGLTVVHGVRTLGWRQAPWIIAAALFAAASGLGLLATNYDIAYLAMGAWFGLLVAVWLGFGMAPRGPFFVAGLVLPLVGIGALAWQSAWAGQRSQFGYSQAARTAYVAAEDIAPDFSYLRGTRLPPELAGSMRAAAERRQRMPEADRQRTFYGPSLEWLERVWPTTKIQGMSLWIHGGTSYGPAEREILLTALGVAGTYVHVLVPEAWDQWKYAVTPEHAGKWVQRRLGLVWFSYDKMDPGIVSLRPFEFLGSFGGNVNSTHLVSTLPRFTLADGRVFLGTTGGRALLRLKTPTYRVEGEAVLQRQGGAALPAGATVHFEVYSLYQGMDFLRWSADLTLPADQDELVVKFPVDCGNSPLRFMLTVPPELAGKVAAGWRGIKILHAEADDQPGQMHPESAPALPGDATTRAALLPPGWDPPAVYLRGGRPVPEGIELPAGGEIWIRLAGNVADVRGTAVVAAGADLQFPPVVRVFFAKGAKLEVLSQAALSPGQRQFDFNAWSAEPEGWIVIMADPSKGAPPVTVRLHSARPSP